MKDVNIFMRSFKDSKDETNKRSSGVTKIELSRSVAILALSNTNLNYL